MEVSSTIEKISSAPPPLNADTVAFCPYADWEDLLACGCYELIADESPPRRIGRLALLSATKSAGLVEACAIDDTGVLDCAWLPAAASVSFSKRYLAAATSSCDARIYDVQWPAAHNAAEATSPRSNEASSASLVEVSRMACEDAGEACMGLDWSLDVATPRVALTGTSGRAYIGELCGAGLRPIAAWQAHEMEGWSVAFDVADTQTLYTGADDATLKRWDLRCLGGGGGGGGDGGSSGGEEPSEPVATASNRRSHGAGVCCISPHRTRPHLVATGSYDEVARLWDVRSLRAPVAEAPCGGGVWRLKWHPEEDGLLLAACMHSGFAVLRVDGLPTASDGMDGGVLPDSSWGGLSLGSVATYQEHGLGAKGLGYGADWARSPPRGSAGGGGGKAGRGLLAATCSFYDRQLHLWQMQQPEL